MTAKERISFRVPPDIADEIEERAEEQGVAQSDILRRLIRYALTTEPIDKRLSELEEKIEEENQGGLL